MAEVPTPFTAGYRSLRAPSVGIHGMVTSAHPWATAAGLRALRAGGHAIDAAVAVAAALNVTEPDMSGMAGVGWMLIHHADSGEGEVLNYSGYAPSGAEPGRLTSTDSWTGALAPVVPGALAGWSAAHRRYGRLPWGDLFEDAVRAAERGQPLTRHQAAIIAFAWSRKFGGWEGFERVYLPQGRPPSPGEVLRQPELAGTLKAVAEQGADHLYRGGLGRQLVAHVQAEGGLITADDLADYEPQWESCLYGTYRGHTLRTLLPNASAFQLIETMNLLEGFDLAALDPSGPDLLHLVAEAGKIAASDRIAYSGDPRTVKIPLEGLISKPFAALRRPLIDAARAAVAEGNRLTRPVPDGALRPADPGGPLWGLTTHFSVVDAERNVVTVTQTNGMIFGAGVVVPGTGLVLNNGLHWFELDEGTPSGNLIAPRKRFEMPLMPVQVLRDGQPILSTGTPGNHGIPHTTALILSHVLDHGADIQEAIEAPRVKPSAGRTLETERSVPLATRAELERRGHELVLYAPISMELGGVQGITLDPESGALLGGADPRRDGVAMGW